MVLRRLSGRKTAIAEREQIGQMLLHLGVVTEQTCEGIVIVDLKGILHFVNTRWVRMHGYETGNELLGKQISMFYNADQMKNKVIPLSEQAKRSSLSEGTAEQLRKDGKTFHTKVKMIPLADEQGNTNGLMVFVEDITEYKQLEDKLKETTEQAERSSKQVEQLQRETNESKEAGNRLRQQVDELTAANGELQHQISECRQAENELKECRERLQQETAQRERVENELQESRNQLEQRAGEQTEELKTANEQLKGEIEQHKQAEDNLRQQIAKLATANEQLRQKLTKGQGADQAGGQDGPMDVQALKEIADLAKGLE
ncbi:MAG: PAS domain-containing protein [Planctomycetota bacterium]|jgi:PAS domain S-box-containing protein